ncbi:hypothetical protein QFC20_006698 [Naganishia adeliensis]|uniref:Uncharacterized protein n=1 Tax=Naganishia adeliensis TaxID=92952 RepID=A0ACC2V8M8_9TREE|nr:hypothetical protein QFC20_006698 [Naganishia adeliensis]
MQKQQAPKGVPEMSASELGDHWQAEVDRLLEVHSGLRIANENMVPGRKWTSNEAAQYATYQEWAKENGWPTRRMDQWGTEYEKRHKRNSKRPCWF